MQAGGVCNQGDITLTVNGSILTAQDIYTTLKNDLLIAEENFKNQNFWGIPWYFLNSFWVPDGGTLYGIVLHQSNPATGPFVNSDTENGLTKNVELKNIVIHDLSIWARERVALQVEGETKTSNFTDA